MATNNTRTAPKFRPYMSAAALQLTYRLLKTKLDAVTTMDAEYAATKEAYLAVGRAMLTAQIAPENAAYVPSDNPPRSVASSLGLDDEELAASMFGTLPGATKELSDYDKMMAMSPVELEAFNAQMLADILAPR